MKLPLWMKLRTAPAVHQLADGTQLRLLTAQQVLEARREALELVQEDREKALCSNACLLARGLVKNGKPVFSSGQEVLRRLTVQQIQTLAQTWAAFDKKENPGLSVGKEEVDALKKACRTRHRND